MGPATNMTKRAFAVKTISNNEEEPSESTMPSNKTKNLSRICVQSTLLALLISFSAYAQDNAPTNREQQAAQLRVEVDSRIAELDEEYAARVAELREQFEASKRELYENADDVFQRSTEETAINRVYQDSLTSLQREINSRRNAVYAAQREANGQLIMEGAISPSTWAAISSAPLVNVAIDPGMLDLGTSVDSASTEAATRDLPEETTTRFEPSVTSVYFDSDRAGANIRFAGSGLQPVNPDAVGLRIQGLGTWSEYVVELAAVSWSEREILADMDYSGYSNYSFMDQGRKYEIYWKPDGHVFASWVERTDAQIAAGCATTSDADGDGVDAIECGGADCDDSDADRFPGNPERGDPGGHDEDCDPNTLGGPNSDFDNDGFVSIDACNLQGSGELKCGTDCDDSNPSIHPGMVDICDGRDNDCDGTLDDQGLISWYPDRDRDLFGDASARSDSACHHLRPDGWVDNNYDCDDSDPTINPITGRCGPGQ